MTREKMEIWQPSTRAPKKNTIAESRKVIRDALIKDKDLRWGYISNIAMLLHDRYGITNYNHRNRAASEILKLIFWSK